MGAVEVTVVVAWVMVMHEQALEMRDAAYCVTKGGTLPPGSLRLISGAGVGASPKIMSSSRAMMFRIA